MDVVGTILERIGDTVLGALIMVGISWYFFKKQAKDLESKVLPLEQVITLVAHYTIYNVRD